MPREPDPLMAGDGPSHDDLRMQRVYRRWFAARARAELGPVLLAALAKYGKQDRFGSVMRLLVGAVAHFDEDEEDVARAELRTTVRRLLPAAVATPLLGLLLSYRPRFRDTGALQFSDGTAAGAPDVRVRHVAVPRSARPAPKIVGPRPPCLCGCGELPKGKAARYLPGHDARCHHA